ncbi:MAG: FHA domain-containing protein [Anaerolineales bacterium]
MAASFRMVVRTGPNPGMVYELTKEVALAGRDVTNDLVLGDAEVSRQHARLTRGQGGIVLEDLGSTNGTFVNGERLAAPRLLRPGDLVQMGENVTMIYESTAPESAATVMGGARPTSSPRQAPPARVPAEAPVMAGTDAAGEPPAKGGRRRWLLAGCGCLVLLAVCAGLFYVMDAYYPDILYAPLRSLGF